MQFNTFELFSMNFETTSSRFLMIEGAWRRMRIFLLFFLRDWHRLKVFSGRRSASKDAAIATSVDSFHIGSPGSARHISIAITLRNLTSRADLSKTSRPSNDSQVTSRSQNKDLRMIVKEDTLVTTLNRNEIENVHKGNISYIKHKKLVFVGNIQERFFIEIVISSLRGMTLGMLKPLLKRFRTTQFGMFHRRIFIVHVWQQNVR